MFPKKNSRRGISTVLTTMIILVASVVLGTGVVIYGTSLFQTGAQQEAIATQGTVLWVHPTDSKGITWGAAGVRNSGDKLVSLDNIQVRGTSIPFSNMYIDKDPVRVTNDNFQSQFNHTTTDSAGMMKNSTTAMTGTCPTTSPGPLMIDQDGAGTKPRLCLTKASGPTALVPGEKLIVYFRVPDGVINAIDSGATSSVSIFAGKAGAPTSVTISNSKP